MCAAFGPARFRDARLQDLWERISHQGGRELLKKADRPDETIKIMARTQDGYNVAPLDPALYSLGAQRVHLNMGKGGLIGMLPPEHAHRYKEPNFTGPDDVEIFEDEEGWSFETDMNGVKEHMNSFPFVSEHLTALAELFRELEDLLGDGRKVQGYFPAKIVLATRR